MKYETSVLLSILASTFTLATPLYTLVTKPLLFTNVLSRVASTQVLPGSLSYEARLDAWESLLVSPHKNDLI